MTTFVCRIKTLNTKPKIRLRMVRIKTLNTKPKCTYKWYELKHQTKIHLRMVQKAPSHPSMQLHSKAWSQRPFMHPGRGTQTSQWGPSLKKVKKIRLFLKLKNIQLFLKLKNIHRCLTQGMIRRSNFMRSKFNFFMRSKLWSWDWNCNFSWDPNYDHEIKGRLG
jgi:hypothetical protein